MLWPQQNRVALSISIPLWKIESVVVQLLGQLHTAEVI
jgi:hypothetical protein